MAYTSATLATGTITTQASQSISLTSFYNRYTIIEIILYNLIVSTDNTTLTMRVSANGSTFDSGASNYMWAEGYANTSNQAGSAGGTTTDTSIQVANALGNGSGKQSNIHIKCYNLGSSSFNPTFMIEAAVSNTSTALGILKGSGQRVANQVTEALQFLISAGTFSCSYIVRGYN